MIKFNKYSAVFYLPNKEKNDQGQHCLDVTPISVFAFAETDMEWEAGSEPMMIEKQILIAPTYICYNRINY